MASTDGGQVNEDVDFATGGKQDDIIENQTDGTQKTQIVDNGGTVLDVELDSAKNAAYVQSETLATEAKQDVIISAVEIPTDMEGGGKVSVGTTAVEATFTGTPTKSIIISGDPQNSGLLYVGESNVTNLGANAFTFLEAGESVTIDYDDTTNAIYVVSDTASQNFYKGALI